MKIDFFVPMKPTAKQGDRSRIAKSKSGSQFIAHYKDSQVKKAEWWIAQAAKTFTPPQQLTGPLFMILRAYSEPPASWSNKKQNACLSCEIWPTGKPDADNLCKLVLDALGTSKQFFRNDSQFVFVVIIKMYDRRQGIEVTFGDMQELPSELIALSREFADRLNFVPKLSLKTASI